MKQYIWLTISMILIMNMCKAGQSANTAPIVSLQAKERICKLHNKMQIKYPQLNISPLTIVPDKDYVYAQMNQHLGSTRVQSPFYEDVLDNMLPLQSEPNYTQQPIILSETTALSDQEHLEKVILEKTYLQQPTAILTGSFSAAAIKTATAYTLCFANALRSPSTIIIPNATLAKTFKCFAIPIIVSSAFQSHQQTQAQNFVQKHYQPEPLTTTQQVIKDARDEFKALTPHTQQALAQTHLSTKKILELAQ